MGFLSSSASSVRQAYLPEGVDGEDDDVGVRLGVVDDVEIVELLELEVRVLHVLDYLHIANPTFVKNIDTSSPQVIALIMVFMAVFFSFTFELVKELVRFWMFPLPLDSPEFIESKF